MTVAEMGADLAVGPYVVDGLVRRGEPPARQLGAQPYQVERRMYERWIRELYRQTRQCVGADPGRFDRSSRSSVVTW